VAEYAAHGHVFSRIVVAGTGAVQVDVVHSDRPASVPASGAHRIRRAGTFDADCSWWPSLLSPQPSSQAAGVVIALQQRERGPFAE
jgi:hypothetical protein